MNKKPSPTCQLIASSLRYSGEWICAWHLANPLTAVDAARAPGIPGNELSYTTEMESGKLIFITIYIYTSIDIICIFHIVDDLGPG